MTSKSPKVAIIGAGIIGLSCAWEMAKRGAQVTLFEKQWPPMGASWAAAGMLAPAYEAAAAHGAHPKLFELCRQSAGLWPGFVADIEEHGAETLDFRAGPTLAIAMDEDDAARLVGVAKGLTACGDEVRRLSRDEVRRLERGVSPDMEEALVLPSDGWVDPRQTVRLLRVAIEAKGGVFKIGEAVQLSDALLEEFDALLITTGSETGNAIVPVTGVMLAFRRSDLPLDHVVRCGQEYAVPRGDRVLVGATVGEVADPRAFLLSRAVRFLPRLRSAALVDQWQGYRPATPDHAPILGGAGKKNVFMAAGHYRNGILLAPITGKIMADMILDGRADALADAFAPNRFGATV